MAVITTIKHPMISGYVKGFVDKYEISKNKAKNEHNIFEMFINDLILSTYSNDPNASYEDMETGTAFGIDGVAIFINDKLVESVEDVDYICSSTKKIEVKFLFTQTKTSEKFDRSEVRDFLQGVNRFFNFEFCEIVELKNSWETAKYIYDLSTKFKNDPSLKMYYTALASKKISIKDEDIDPHLKSEIITGLEVLRQKSLFDEDNIGLSFIGLKEIRELHQKENNQSEIKFNLDKQPVPYPKDSTGIIKSAYFGLIKLEDLLDILSEEIDGERILRKGIFEDNIRDYLGANEKFDVNLDMKKGLTGTNAHFFGLLNNGITIIADEVHIISTEASLVNYQIVNGCQTSNVIFESLKDIKEKNIYIPIRLIGTEDEDTKNAIIKATNSQTALKPEQLLALRDEQKSLEEYYKAKRNQNRFHLYYERRTEQYRNENIQKTKIINIPFQIKATSAMFLDLPHEVSGQYGKVEQKTRGKLFTENSFLNPYYVSGLTWYRVEAFIRNNEEGKKHRRARWHIMMVIKYLMTDYNNPSTIIDKNAERVSENIETVMLDDIKSLELIESALSLIKEFIVNEGILDISGDRKFFERKETTTGLIDMLRNRTLIK
ncbi:AIPR family protein [Bacillus sp. FJAT-27445]|uniref:AIPR family protein n=1 Tax=Bacillus sp. FJAT-27445 TaxID=1679166 RepID=UPI000744466E|nr:AIPR family protein [Bacillus sp. FJAT-27445]